MSRGVKFFGVLLGVPAVLLALFYINTYVYPFQSKKPNFSDVEQAFAKLQFPADWQEIQSSENRGIAGRGCDPFNSSGCFHKSKTFKIADTVTQEDVKQVFLDAGCESVSVTDNTHRGEVESSYNLRCNLSGGLSFGGSLRGPENEVYIVARTY